MEEEWINEDAIVKRRASHIRSCCAEGCTSKGYRLLIAGERVQYFPFPLYDQDLCHRWASAIKLPPGTPFEKSFVCSKHFRPTDYKTRLHDEGKRTLRRTAIPSWEPVVSSGKPYKKKSTVDDSSDTTEDDEDEEKEVTTLVSKDVYGEGNLKVLVVKDPYDDTRSDEEVTEKPKVLLESKKVPLLIHNLLAMGPPFPWRKQGLDGWTSDRLADHEAQLEKIRDAITDENEKINILQEQVDARKEILALVIVKKSMGRMVLSQYLRTLS